MQDTVFLNWAEIRLDDLTGFRVYRKSEVEDEFAPIGFNPPDDSEFIDSDIAFNVNYSYQVSAVGATYESERSEPVVIMPGPTSNWVADNITNLLTKLTHDARHPIVSSGRFATIVDLEVNPISGEVWLLERVSVINGNVRKITAEGRILDLVIRLVAPVDAAIDAATGALWVADARDSLLIKLDANGNPLFSIDEFSNPVAVSVDQRDGSCWAANQATGEVAEVSADGQEIRFASVRLTALQSLAVHSGDGSVWLADSSRVVKLDENGALLLQLDTVFDFAFKVAVDDSTGDVWVLDHGASTISKFSASGQRAFEIGALLRPEDLAINLFDHSCLVADTGNRRLVRMSADGTIQHVFEDVRFPVALAIQNRLAFNNGKK